MPEQELITTEETKEGIIETKKGKKSVFKKNKIYHSDEFLELLGKWYTEYGNCTIVADKLNERFKTSITSVHVKNLYTKNLGTKILKDERAKEFFEDSFTKMKERWDDAWNLVGDLITEYKKLKERIKESGESDQTLLILKMTPTIIQIAQEIRKQLEFIRTEQEQIKIQQTNLIYSPIQINQYINNFLKSWVEEGYIRVLKKIPGVEYIKEGGEKNAN